jgi:hypothetical protein
MGQDFCTANVRLRYGAGSFVLGLLVCGMG